MLESAPDEITDIAKYLLGLFGPTDYTYEDDGDYMGRTTGIWVASTLYRYPDLSVHLTVRERVTARAELMALVAAAGGDPSRIAERFPDHLRPVEATQT